MGSQYFPKDKFTCPCCGRGYDKIHPKLFELLDLLREKTKNHFEIIEGYTCPKDRITIHSKGVAAKIAPKGIDLAALKDFCEKLPFDGIGTGQLTLEVDVRNGGINSGIRWEYKESKEKLAKIQEKPVEQPKKKTVKANKVEKAPEPVNIKRSKLLNLLG